jgi:hypothetical protein
VSDLVTVGLRDPAMGAYLRAASRAWPWAAAVVLPVVAGGAGRVLALMDAGELRAGALISAAPVNVFVDRHKRWLAKDYHANGYANLSYFAVPQDQRRAGYGSAFLRALARDHSFWLACDPELAGFYRGAGMVPSALDGAFHHHSAAG